METTQEIAKVSLEQGGFLPFSLHCRSPLWLPLCYKPSVKSTTVKERTWENSRNGPKIHTLKQENADRKTREKVNWQCKQKVRYQYFKEHGEYDHQSTTQDRQMHIHMHMHKCSSRNTDSLRQAVDVPHIRQRGSKHSVVTPKEQNEQLKNEFNEKTALSMILYTNQ